MLWITGDSRRQTRDNRAPGRDLHYALWMLWTTR
jgi:hypothetical protein